MPYLDPATQREKEDFGAPHDSLSQSKSWKIFKIMAEFVEGYTMLAEHVNEVTIFGSARTDPSDHYYKEAERLGFLLGSHKFTTITGGGPGIMEAANKGAFEAKGVSIGFGIELPHEQSINPYVTHSFDFHYFFTRKVMLTAPSQAYVYFPGGFGTLDELFQVLNEASMGFTQKVPVILVGHEFWDPLVDFLKTSCMGSVSAINPDYIENMVVVDSAEEAFTHIKETEDHPNLSDISPLNPSGSLHGVNWRIFKIMSEFVEGLDFLAKLDKNVTFLGSSRISKDSPYYEKAYTIAKKLAEQQYSVVTGGSHGLAEAANKASRDANQPGYALAITLDDLDPHKRVNEYVTDLINFKFPFTRQFILTGPSNSYLFCPGGLGTLHQLFEVLTLVQTQKVTTSPLIIYDKDFWQPMITYIDEILYKKFRTISPEDRDLYHVISDEREVVEIIDKAFSQ